jgi:hypothetical protein
MGLLQTGLTLWPALCVTLIALLLSASRGVARDAGDPIRLRWTEGDVSGFTSIHSPDGKQVIGVVEYAQSRQGDVLFMRRVSRFTDGSSDEDQAEAYVARSLCAVRGRSVIRDTGGHPTVDLQIDVAHGRITGFTNIDGDRRTYDEHVDLPPATYWGPLVFIVLKNFDANAEDGRVVFRTVAATPQPRVFDLEIVRKDTTQLTRPGWSLDAVRFELQPSFNWLVDPLLHMFVPDASFFVVPTTPPSLARFAGPRNYAGQEIQLE